MAAARPRIILFDGEIPQESTPQASFIEMQQQSKVANGLLFDPHRDHRSGSLPRPPPSTNFQQRAPTPARKPVTYNPSNYGFAAKMRSSKAMFLGAVVGAAVGGVLANYKTLNGDDITPVAAQWVSLVGSLFYRAMTCIVIPLVLSSMALSVSEMLRIGKGTAISWRVAIYFLITKILAASTGLVIALAFASSFQNIDPSRKQSDITSDAKMWLRCGSLPSDEKFMTLAANGSITCMAHDSSNPASMANASFVMRDTNNVFVKNADIGAMPKRTFAQAVIDISNDIVPDNVVKAMVSTNVLSVAMFGILFGAAVCKNYRQNSTGTHYVMDILRQVNHVCTVLVHWLLVVAPLGVASLVAGAAATNEPIVGGGKAFFEQTYYFMLAFGIALVVYTGVLLPLFLGLLARMNPYPFMAQIFPAQLFAFCTASSAATLPITIRCIEATKEVRGSAIYLSVGIVFLANTASVSLSGLDLFLTVLLSLIASVAVAPVPGGCPAVLYCIWTSLSSVNTNQVPGALQTLLLLDWFVDRFTAAVNITGDTVVARVIAQQIDEQGGLDEATAEY
ncbi:dicarboxylate/amino acid:cation (Na or H) symporter (DAACS) family protein [Achlya hypogyna]|uniref:Amino acid transporter n=1 Tax=Achlya hypogyna TaxID=1202772 RepID=A0A1V9Z6E0_ACHHY|nr:dicarboxylate/amino acid:cation (Na or H) symporter (DAACS) family protein [Achlya hypogyna]